MIYHSLNEMAILYDFHLKNTDYSIEIHGANNNERALPPHVHIYGFKGKQKVENIEISLSDYLEYNRFVILRIDNFAKHIHITNRKKCSWDYNPRLYDMIEEMMIESPTNNKYKSYIDYIHTAINVWNRETDPKTIRQELQYVPEPYRIIIAMREMNKTISTKNRRKYFKGIDIDKVIKKYYIPDSKKRR